MIRDVLKQIPGLRIELSADGVHGREADRSGLVLFRMTLGSVIPIATNRSNSFTKTLLKFQ